MKGNIKFVSLYAIFFLSVFFVTTSRASAATYYASPAGSGSACSSASPCSLSGGLGKLAGGDTLILKDGTYTQLIGYYGTFPPSGISASQRTVIRAENVGQAIIDGQYNNAAVYMYDGSSNIRNYIEFDGIHFRRGNNGVFFLGGNYNYVHNCGFEDGGSSGNPGEFPIAIISESSYTVVEDCWVWGRGRYGLYTTSANGGTNHVIFRRIVVRQDSVPPWVSAAFRFYLGDTNTCQNCFAIDGDLTGASEASVFTMGGGSSFGDENNHLWDSCIALNYGGMGFRTEDMQTLNTWTNSIIWNNSDRGMSTTSDSGSGTLSISNMTVGENTSYQFYTNGQLTWNLSNSLVVADSGSTAFNALDSVTGTYYYLNGGSRGDAVGTALTQPNYQASLKYLPRIEAGSTVGNAGAGANILYQKGMTGTYYGQTGWNTTTSTQLWPLPNEDMWAAKMKAYTASGPGGNRGFAALASIQQYPFTSYIWNYLGSSPVITDPSQIYGSIPPDTEPPTSPTNLSATSPSQSSISVSWNPATDNVGVTGYIVERCQGSGCSNFTQVGTPTSSPFTDSALTPNTFYNYHVRATDAAGNLSGWSNVVGATTQAPDTTPPTAPASLSASVVSSSNINLIWTASTDTVGVTGYKVERCSGTSCTNFAEVGTPTATSYSDTGLSATTLYRYRVRATDAAGNNSNYSNIASATTPQAPPTPTFISEYETAWNSATSPKTTANFSVQTGDILVAYAVNESSGSTIATPPTGTLSGTWTLRQTVSATDYTSVRLWTLPVTTNQSNVNVSFSNSSGNFGGNVLHFRNASSVGVTQQATGATGNPTLTVNGVEENSSIVMVNGDWSARTGARTYNTTQAGSFTETTAYADGTSYGVEAGYYPNAGTAGNKTIGLTAPTGMKWALAAIEVKGNPTQTGPQLCNTVTTSNFSQSAYNSYGAPYDAFQTSTNLMNTTCTSADTHTINLTTGVTGDTTRIVYTKGYWYDAVTTAWRQYTGTCTGALNGEWCQGSVSATITDPNVSTANAANPTYLVGMTCSVQGGGWKCGCRDTSCTNFSWQIQGAGM